MPNAVDVFAIFGTVDSEAATIRVESYDSTVGAGESFVVPIKYNPGFDPAATDIGFAVYDTAGARQTVQDNILAGTQDSNWSFGSGSSELAAQMTPSGAAAMETSRGEHSGQIDGTVPAGLAANKTYYGLVAIRQGPLNNP